MQMNNKILGIITPLLCGLVYSNVQAGPFDIDLSGVVPASIEGYVDNSSCLRDSSVVCASNIDRTLHTDILFKTAWGGFHGLLDWGNTSLKLIPDASFQNGEYVVNDSLGNMAYKILFDGEVVIEQVFVASDINGSNMRWQNCVGPQNKLNLRDALNGQSMKCSNLNTNEWLFGLKVSYHLKGSLHRVGSGDVREIQLPKDLKLEVEFNGKQQNGQPYYEKASAVWFKGGKIKLNDRKCYINISELKVNFGDLSPTASQPDELKSEKLTPIPLYCSGYPTTLEGKQVSINGSGVKSVINGISIQAINLDEANNKRIAVPDRENLFVEVGPSQAGVCNASSSVLVNGQSTDVVGPKQENGPVYNQNGYLDATPINLYWRLCQKRPNEPLPSRPLENKVAATIRVHYN